MIIWKISKKAQNKQKQTDTWLYQSIKKYPVLKINLRVRPLFSPKSKSTFLQKKRNTCYTVPNLDYMLEKYYQRIINNSCNHVHFQNNECLYMYNDQEKNLTSDRTTNKFTNSEFVGDIVRNKRSAKWFSGPLRECTVRNVIWKLVCLIAIKIYHKADF